MTDSLTPSAQTKTPRKRAEQDQGMANAISEAAKLIRTALDKPEILELMAPRGYDSAALEEALETKYEPAQAAFDARQVSMGLLAGRMKVLAETEAIERRDFADYREIARTCFPAAADRLALGLNGGAPKDLEKFLTTATASYGAGKKAPYTAKLTVRGYSPTMIDAELEGLKAIGNLAKAAANAKGEAKKATETRDKAAKALAGWVWEFRKVAKRTLRSRPDLLTALKI